MFQFVLVMFGVVIIMNIDAMTSFADAIYEAVTTSFSFLPLVALVGALAYLGTKGR